VGRRYLPYTAKASRRPGFAYARAGPFLPGAHFLLHIWMLIVVHHEQGRARPLTRLPELKQLYDRLALAIERARRHHAYKGRGFDRLYRRRHKMRRPCWDRIRALMSKDRWTGFAFCPGRAKDRNGGNDGDAAYE